MDSPWNFNEINEGCESDYELTEEELEYNRKQYAEWQEELKRNEFRNEFLR